MSTPPSKGGDKTIADWLALPPDARIELIDGEFVEKAAPSFEHGRAQGKTVALLSRYDQKPGSSKGPGGWWIATEVDVLLDGRIYRPDIAGWLRERWPSPGKERPVRVRPDWICEVVSESNRTIDTVKKLRRYHQGAVPSYWILDQLDQTLTVYRHTVDGYLLALRAAAEERVRAEPFDAVELKVAALLGLEDDE